MRLTCDLRNPGAVVILIKCGKCPPCPRKLLTGRLLQTQDKGQQTKGLIKCGMCTSHSHLLLTDGFLQSQGKGQQTKGLIKCGKCPPCLRPQMRKACLRPLFVGSSAADPTGAPSK